MLKFNVLLNENGLADEGINEPDDSSIPNICVGQNNFEFKITDIEIRKEVDSSVYICSYCKKEFKFKVQASQHINIHRRENPNEVFNVTIIDGEFNCDKCSSSFNTKEFLDLHETSNHGPAKCHICYKVFKSKPSLKRHYRIHTKETPFECKICGDVFPFDNVLKQHYISHANERFMRKQEPLPIDNFGNQLIDSLYRCEQCPETFSNKLSLDKHFLVHEIGDCFQCRVCQKYFRRIEQLRQHSGVHTGDKPFQCDVCYKGFKCQSSLIAHTSMMHSTNHNYDEDLDDPSNVDQSYSRDSEQKPHACETCYKRFKYESGLLAHYSTHKLKNENVPEHCLTIPEQIAQNISLQAEQKPYLCEVCQKRFKHESSLLAHQHVHQKGNPMFVGK